MRNTFLLRHVGLFWGQAFQTVSSEGGMVKRSSSSKFLRKARYRFASSSLTANQLTHSWGVLLLRYSSAVLTGGSFHRGVWPGDAFPRVKPNLANSGGSSLSGTPPGGDRSQLWLSSVQAWLRCNCIYSSTRRSNGCVDRCLASAMFRRKTGFFFCRLRSDGFFA